MECERFRVLAIALVTRVDLWTAALYSLGSGSWLAWASRTTAHYVAIHPLPAIADNWTHGAAWQIYHCPISHTRPLPIDRKLLLINWPLVDGMLSSVVLVGTQQPPMRIEPMTSWSQVHGTQPHIYIYTIYIRIFLACTISYFCVYYVFCVCLCFFLCRFSFSTLNQQYQRQTTVSKSLILLVGSFDL